MSTNFGIIQASDISIKNNKKNIKNMNENTTEHRVRYADTDNGGVAYYARYLEWLEVGRTELLRKNGITYAVYEKKGQFAPVININLTYKSPARYDDLLVLKTSIREIGNSSIKFVYELTKKEDSSIIAYGETTNIFVHKNLRPIPVPKEIRDILG